MVDVIDLFLCLGNCLNAIFDFIYCRKISLNFKIYTKSYFIKFSYNLRLPSFDTVVWLMAACSAGFATFIGRFNFFALCLGLWTFNVVFVFNVIILYFWIMQVLETTSDFTMYSTLCTGVIMSSSPGLWMWISHNVIVKGFNGFCLSSWITGKLHKLETGIILVR